MSSHLINKTTRVQQKRARGGRETSTQDRQGQGGDEGGSNQGGTTQHHSGASADGTRVTSDWDGAEGGGDPGRAEELTGPSDIEGTGGQQWATEVEPEDWGEGGATEDQGGAGGKEKPTGAEGVDGWSAAEGLETDQGDPEGRGRPVES